MQKDDVRFQQAYAFAFEEVFTAIKSDLDQIFRLGTREDQSGNKEGINLSACILVLSSIKAMSQFYNFGGDITEGVHKFVFDYFPSDYRWRFKKFFQYYNSGLIQHFSTSVAEQVSWVRIVIPTNEEGFLKDLDSLKGDSGAPLRAFEEKFDGTLFVYPQILYLDFLTAVEKFKTKLLEKSADRQRVTFFRNFEKAKRRLAGQENFN